MTFYLFHTNDFHGRLTVEAAAVLRAARERCPGSLLLDAGDAVSAGNLGFRPGGEPVLVLMSDLGYDAMAVGNRESHPRREIFPRKLRDARFPVLCANLTARAGARVPTRPYRIVTVRDEADPSQEVRVALLGLSVPMFTRKMWSQAVCDYFYEDPVQTARELVPRLRAEVRLVVALTHLGLQRDAELAAAVPGIDLIVGGHTHADLAEPWVEAGVPILHTTAYAAYVGRARVELRPDGARLVEWSRLPLRKGGSLLPLSSGRRRSER